MSQGQGSISVNQKAPVIPPPGPPFTSNSADNGLSVDPITGRIVFGQDIATIGDPAMLLSAREIPLNNFPLSIGTAVAPALFIDQLLGSYYLGDVNALAGGTAIYIEDSLSSLFMYGGGGELNMNGTGGVNLLSIGNFFQTAPQLLIDMVNDQIDVRLAGSVSMLRLTNGLIQLLCGGAGFNISAAPDRITASASEFIFGNDVSFHRNTSPLTDGAGVLAGTLLNSPVAGDPTKWLEVNDAGVTRYVPAW